MLEMPFFFFEEKEAKRTPVSLVAGHSQENDYILLA